MRPVRTTLLTAGVLAVPLVLAPAATAQESPAPSSSSSPSPGPSASGHSPSPSPCETVCKSPAPTPDSVTLASIHGVITAGNSPTLSGHVRQTNGQPQPNGDVLIHARQYGQMGYTVVAQVQTDANGDFEIVVRPTIQTSYVASVMDARSTTVLVAVHTRINIQWVIDHDHAVLDVGGSLTPAGQVRVGLARVVSGRYEYLSEVRSTDAGEFRMTRPIPRGRYVLIVYTPQRPGNSPGSRSVSVTV